MIEECYGKGLYILGNCLLVYLIDIDMCNLLYVQFIEDMMDEEVIYFFDQYKDCNMLLVWIEFVEECINDCFKVLMVGDDFVIYGGQFCFDWQKIIKFFVVDMQFYWCSEYVLVGIGEIFMVDCNIDFNLISNVFGLVV